ncbi:MAG: HAMP domain-containing protein [Phycisphaerales bacterium]|nr:HAMP domain-containing protein [Phycisphaerales bacterium]
MDHLIVELHPRWTLRRRMVAMIGAPLLLTFCIIIAVQFSSQRELLIDALRQETRAQVLRAALRVDAEFLCITQAVESRVATLRWIGDQLDLRGETASRVKVMQLLADDLDTDDFIFGAGLAFPPGTPGLSQAGYAPYVCRSIQPKGATTAQRTGRPYQEKDVALTQDFSVQPWFRDAALHPKGFWTEPYFDAGGGEVLMVTYSLPFSARGALPAGVAATDVSLRDIRHAMKSSDAQEPAKFAIVSVEDEFISYPKANALKQGLHDFAPKSLEHDVLVAAAAFRSGGPEFVRVGSSGEYSFDGTRLVFVTMPTTEWVFVGFFPESMVVPAVLRALALGPGVLLIGVIAALTIVWFGANAVVQPLCGVSAAIARLATGDLKSRAPATHRRDEIGVLSRAFNRMGDELEEAIAARESAVEKRLAVEAQVEAAREIQRLLLPDSEGDDAKSNMRLTSEFAGLRLLGTSEPAGEIAGDFFDWFARADGAVVVMIADVCGKGMAAAMMMAVSRTLVRSAAMESSDPSVALATINRQLIAQAPQTKFTTGILLYIDAVTGAIRYANAGHPLAVLVSIDGSSSEVLPATGTVLGIQADAVWTTGSLALAPGERLVLFTDGVTEAMPDDNDPQMIFGSVRAMEAISAPARAGETGVDPIVRSLVAAVERFSLGNRHDDLTVVALERQ